MRSPNIYKIILSDDRSFRWQRHFVFWLAVFFYHLVRIGIMMPGINNWSAFGKLVEFSFFRGVIPNILFTYSVVYYLIPKCFKRGAIDSTDDTFMVQMQIRLGERDISKSKMIEVPSRKEIAYA